MRLDRGAVLLVGAALMAALVSYGISYYSVPLLLVIALGVLTLAFMAALPGAVPPGWAVSLSAAITVIALVPRMPIRGVEAPTPWLEFGLAIGGAVAVLVAVLPFLPSRRQLGLVAIAGMAVSFGCIILGGRPLIDVWILLRDAGAGLLHGLNPYELKFPDAPPDQDNFCFPYAPGAFLWTAPAQWLMGDVRWVESACLIAAVALAWWHATNGGRDRDDKPIAVALLLGAMPGTLHVVEQSWTEPMLLLGMLAGAVLIDRGRANWAIVPLGLALATKQYLVVLLPLLIFWPNFGWRRFLGCLAVAAAVCLPWFVANPERFIACTIDFHITFQPEFERSMSLWHFLPRPMATAAVLIALVAAYAVAVWRAPRTGAGFLMAAGVVLAAFDFANKNSFLNEWWGAVELMVAGLAIAGAARQRAATMT